MDKPRAYVAWDQGEDDGAVFHARLTRTEDGRLVTWNGFLSPEFDRATAERIVAWNEKAIEEFGRDAADAFRWYGDVLVERWSGAEEEVDWPETLSHGEDAELPEPFEVVKRTGDGLYPIGAWAWTWDTVDDLPHDFLSREAALADAGDAPADACVFCQKAESWPIHPFR